MCDTLCAEASILGIVFLTVAGPMLMPILSIATRIALRFAVREGLATARSEALKLLLILVMSTATALVVAVATPIAAEARQAKGAPSSPANPGLAAQVRDLFLSLTSTVGKPAPVWVADLALRIYTAWEAHKATQHAEEAGRRAALALGELAALRTEIEAGRALADAERERIEARFRAHTDAIAALATRVAGLEVRQDHQEGRLRDNERATDHIRSRVIRPGCPYLHAFDKTLRRCTNRQ
jgi:hypothetical protein